MHVPIERFVGVLDDFSVLFLQTCAKCRVLITYPEQGHQCDGKVDVTEVRRVEAANYVQLMQRVKKLYVLPNFDAPRE
jgi:hypothetical protein